MVSVSKLGKFFLLTVLVAVTLATAFAVGGDFAVAAADGSQPNADFSVVYPTEGYFPVSDAQLLAANADYLAVYDGALQSLVVTGETEFACALDYAPDGMWLSGSLLLMHFGDESAVRYATVDLTVSPVLTDVTSTVLADASYIVADDSYIYAKSDDTLAIYTTDGGLKSYGLIENDPNLNGKYIFAANDRTLYFYAQSYETRRFFICNCTSTDAMITYMSSLEQMLPAVATYIDGGLLVDRNGELVVVDRNDDGEGVILSTGIKWTNDTVFSAYGDRVFVVNENGGVDEYRVSMGYETEEGVTVEGKTEFVRTYAMNGSTEGQLDAPTDIVFAPVGTVIADSNNMRLAVLNGSQTEYAEADFVPTSLAVNSQGVVYVASEDALYTLSRKNGSLTLTKYLDAPEDETVLDIACFGNFVVVLTDTSLHLVALRNIMHSAPVSDGIAAAVSPVGSTLYVMTKDGVHTLTVDTSTPSLTNLIDFREADFSAATDIATDYAGTLFVAFEDARIASFSNEVGAVELQHEYIFDDSFYIAKPAAIQLNGSEAYFASSTCFIGRAEVGAVDEDAYSPIPDPDISVATTNRFAVTSEDGYLFDEPGRFDTMLPVAEGSVLYVHDGVSSVEGYAYAYINGRRGYISSSLLADISPSDANKGAYSAAQGSELFNPDPAASPIRLADSAVIEVIDNAAGIDGGVWWRVHYNNEVYFVRASELTPYEEVLPEPEKVFGRASADRAGGIVNIYAVPDTTSTVVLEVVDGTRLEILGEDGDFYLVGVNGMTGYALKDDVELEGLTTVQIVSIVLAVAVAVTGLIVFVVTWQSRKKEKEKQ